MAHSPAELRTGELAHILAQGTTDMLHQHNRSSVKTLVIFGSGLAYVLSIVMMEALVGFALSDIATTPVMQALVGIGILGTFISACLIPLALHYWLAPGTQFKIGIGFWLIDIAVLALNATTSYQLIKQYPLSSFFAMWQLAIPFVGPALTILGWGVVYLADDGQKDRHADRLLETTKRDLIREAEFARASAEHEFAMKQIEQVKQTLMLAINSADVSQVAERGAYNSAMNITRQLVGLPVNNQPVLPQQQQPTQQPPAQPTDFYVPITFQRPAEPTAPVPATPATDATQRLEYAQTATNGYHPNP